MTTDRNLDLTKASLQRLSPLFNNDWTAKKECFFYEIIKQQEDHDGPISITWANSFAYLLLNVQPSSLL